MQEENKVEAAEAGNASGPDSHSVISESSPEERIAQLEAELADARDQFLRSRAEMENLRRRNSEDVGNAQKYAINKFASELLGVKDSLEMALADQSGQFEALKFGVDLTLKQLVGAFEKVQLREIDPLGESLDPHKHQAIDTEVSDAAPNTIVRVRLKGYLLADRVLRPAMVVVAKPADQND
ncbi:nucleotide exchange factor GrpE [Paludibacterium yongneupense]|uniref:nucleotide exchange factor GrpE n=1 Tax=Paludibacterium yongneupense TaxID=400061 RepID=UPI000412E368|nr:nucleotide exchange factor GrpE [Paludibacterium yongneupense]